MHESSGNARRRERPAGRATRSGVPAAASVSARTTMRRASSILKALSPDGLASASAASRGAAEGAASGLAPASMPLGRTRAPRLCGDAAERDPRLDDRAVLDPQRGGGRHDGEGVGRALADLQIARMRREARAPRPAGAPRRSDRRARARSRARARRRAGGGAPPARSRGGRSCPRSRPRRRARPAARRNRTDGWRCRPRSSRARRAAGSRRRARRSRAPGSRLLQALAAS